MNAQSDPRSKSDPEDEGNESSPSTPAPESPADDEPLPGWTQEELDAARPAPMPEVDDDESEEGPRLSSDS